MAEPRVERRLAAILAADVAGYTRLMGADEEDTLRRLKAHRSELVDPKITEYRGRIVKTTGDGILVEFVSVVDAVRCAVDIQRGMQSARSIRRLLGHRAALLLPTFLPDVTTTRLRGRKRRCAKGRISRRNP
jgi:class 3 adenylate cyclase